MAKVTTTPTWPTPKPAQAAQTAHWFVPTRLSLFTGLKLKLRLKTDILYKQKLIKENGRVKINERE